MNVGDILYVWPDDKTIGLIVGFISDHWSDRFVVLSEGEIFEIPIQWDEIIEVKDEAG